ncbi:MAG: hypothetical protein M1838_000462 [Thelocarpon superellum]|nr:MAG: hypothetical protein M1838_000462 [Thelocarpon superellum]
MASPQVVAELARLEPSSVSASDKANGYANLLKILLQDPSPDHLTANLRALLDSILGETVGIVAARPLLSTFVESLKAIHNSELQIDVGQHALDLLQPRVVSFEEQDASIRDIMAEAYEATDEHTAAAKVLQGIQLDSSQRMISDDEKVRVWIRIVRNYLEDDDSINAEIYLMKAKNLVYKCEDQELNLMFQLSQARILDARRRFLEACQAYHTLSFSPVVVEEERARALSSAIICAVLAPAGPQRSRTLARLYKDERGAQLPEFGILEKMFLDRLLSPDEVEKFAAGLSEHHLARTSDGSTVLRKAVVEHNLLGASRLYNDIGMWELGVLLDLPGAMAEEYAAGMIEQGRLAGHIDQIQQVVYFDGGEGSGERSSAGQTDGVGHSAGARHLRLWDANVQGLAEEVERVTSLLQTGYPDFVASHLVH